VDEKKWISEERFLHALNYCMLLPGPEAQQLATYIGWLMHGVRGGLLAGGLFILPGFLSILVLSLLYASFHETLLLTALFFGLKPAVIAIVFEAVIRIGKRVLKNGAMVAIAAASFLAITLFGVPFPILIAGAAVVGLIGGRVWPNQFQVIKGHGAQAVADSVIYPAEAALAGKPLVSRSLPVSAVCLALWFGPLLVTRSVLGPESVYFQEGLFFSKAAVVTFGGAYSVLSYVAQQAVEKFGWLEPGEMLDGLGMAETTPGPLIMVVQFVGFMGACRHPGPMTPLTAGILGSVMTTWVTFVPCFYWIFLGAPFVERLRSQKILAAGLSAITAAVVGVVLNLALWFAVHTLFASHHDLKLAGIRMSLPELSSVNLPAVLIAVLAGLLTFYWKKGMVVTLLASTAAGVLWTLLFA
jgi:chromate transporter